MNQAALFSAMSRFPAIPYLMAALAGVAAVFGFAPFGCFPLPVLSLALLFWLWERAANPAQAAGLGFAFGLGLFCTGISWLYIALHIYGHMSPLPAALSTVAFAAANAVWPAMIGYFRARFPTTPVQRLLLFIPATWTLAEWARSWLFTGFPWLSLGYSQVPYSPLAGYAPLFGVFGVSLLVLVSAGLLLICWNLRTSRTGRIAAGALAGLWIIGAVSGEISWTQPHGAPLKVSLLQGNIAQDDKFDSDQLINTLETYRRLAEATDARLIILPETALPLLRRNLPATYESLLTRHAIHNGGDILIGGFEEENGNYYNSVYSLGSAPSQHYRKHHLVPFGEYIPLRPVFGWLIHEVLQIPMSDQTPGDAHQAPLAVAGQQVAVNICYEDAFGEEIIRALPQATLLANVTNDAWYGRSPAAMQHNQLSQMRARETGRMVLRATNTGVTSIIDRDGHILAMLPQFERGVLTAEVQGYIGSTPYVRWGNSAILGLVALMLWAARGRQKR